MTLVSKFPTTTSVISGTWGTASAANLQSDNNVYVTNTVARRANSDLTTGGWGFGPAIPAGATINSVVIVFQYKYSATGNLTQTVIVPFIGVNPLPSFTYSGEPTVDTTMSFDVTSLTTWTQTALQDLSVRIRTTKDTGNVVTASYDFIRVDVDYTAGVPLAALVGTTTGTGSAAAAIKLTHFLAGVTPGAAHASALLKGALATVFTVAASGDDAFTQRSDSVYPPEAIPFSDTLGSLTVQRSISDTLQYTVGVVPIRWDTSSIPDAATITAVTLRIVTTNVQRTDNRNLVVEWYSASNWPINDANYTVTAPAAPVGSVALSSLVLTGGIVDIPLSDFSGVSVTGYTGVRLHISGAAPTANNIVTFAAFDTAGQTPPRLLITFGPVVIAGSTVGTGSVTAGLKVAHFLQGAVQGAAAAAGVLLTATPGITHLLLGSTAGTGTTVAAINLTVSLTGAVQGAAAAAGVLLTATPGITHLLAGTTTGTGILVADLRVKSAHFLVGATKGLADAVATVAVQHFFAGTTTGTGSVAAAFTAVAIALDGAVQGKASVVGALTILRHVAGALTGKAAAIATVTAIRSLDGTAPAMTGTAHVVAAVSLSVPLTGQVTGIAAASAVLGPNVHMIGVVIAQATATGSMQLAQHLRAVVNGSALLITRLHVFKQARGTLTGVAATNRPDLHFRHVLGGALAGQALITGVLFTQSNAHLVGSVIGVAAVAAQVRVPITHEQAVVIVHGFALGVLRFSTAQISREGLLAVNTDPLLTSEFVIAGTISGVPISGQTTAGSSLVPIHTKARDA